MLKFPSLNAASGPQARQDTTGGPITVAAVLSYPDPVQYRFFIDQANANKIRRAVDRPISRFGITVDVLPVPADQVDANPDAFAGMVEVNVSWKESE